MKTGFSTPRVLPLTIVVMVLLLAAKAVTFAGEAGAAPAHPKAAAAGAPSVKPAAVSAATPVQSAAPPAEPAPDPNELALLQDLRRRRKALDAREKALDERSAVVEAAEMRLRQKLDAMSAQEAKVSAPDPLKKSREDARWSGLVKVYEDMKPADAAAIFDVLDMHVLLQMLDRMNERKAAAVLAAMQPERARLATQMLAQLRLKDEAAPALVAQTQPVLLAQ